MNCPRRNFLVSLGGVMAASALPAWGRDDPALFPMRGRYEQLVLAYRHIHLGLKNPFTLLHISDTHLTEAYDHETDRHAFRDARRKTFGGRQNEALLSSIAWARKNADYLLHTGDLIDFITDANLDLVRKYYGEVASFAFGTTGNHEYQRRVREEGVCNTDEYNALSRDRLNASFPFDVVFKSNIVNGVNFICVEQVYGFFLPVQVARFKEEVKKGYPIVLCMHAPVYTEEIWRASVKFWNGRGRGHFTSALPPARGDLLRQQQDKTTADFIAYLRKEPLLRAILAGHLHITVQERFSPTAMQYVVGGNFMFHGEEILFT